MCCPLQVLPLFIVFVLKKICVVYVCMHVHMCTHTIVYVEATGQLAGVQTFPFTMWVLDYKSGSPACQQMSSPGTPSHLPIVTVVFDSSALLELPESEVLNSCL